MHDIERDTYLSVGGSNDVNDPRRNAAVVLAGCCHHRPSLFTGPGEAGDNPQHSYICDFCINYILLYHFFEFKFGFEFQTPKRASTKQHIGEHKITIPHATTPS